VIGGLPAADSPLLGSANGEIASGDLFASRYLGPFGSGGIASGFQH
jgi:hypothetical protein